MIARLLFSIILLLSLSTFAAPKADTLEQPKPDWNFVEARLKKNGFKKSFIEEMKKTYEPDGFEEVIRLNVLLFLKKSDYHGPQVTEQATEEVEQFVQVNAAALKEAEKRYGVSGEAIASLLYIESRHGKNVGHFHVPSVFLNMIQASRDDVAAYLLTQTARYSDKVTKKQRREIVRRTKRKAIWALGELRALQKIRQWKWKLDESFYGSFSGAFGMPQFLPSSYTKWARARSAKVQPDLMKPEDAILSVGFYLHEHGWKTQDANSRVVSLMKYNNSLDYANAILRLAKNLEDKAKKPAAAAADKPSDNT